MLLNIAIIFLTSTITMIVLMWRSAWKEVDEEMNAEKTFQERIRSVDHLLDQIFNQNEKETT